MKKEWLVKQQKKRDQEKEIILDKICSTLEENGMPNEYSQHIRDFIIREANEYNITAATVFVELNKLCKIKNIFNIMESLNEDISKYNDLNYPLEVYLDSNQVDFDGDIIITDPCYIAKDEDWTRFYDHPFMPNCMMRDTLYGDWSCTTYDLNTKKEIGCFCADAGLVGVFSFDEVKKYNPDFEKEYQNRDWCWTLIKDFKGKCQFLVKKSRYKYGGNWHNDYYVEVVGHGINKKTGNSIDFVGKQTGL